MQSSSPFDASKEAIIVEKVSVKEIIDAYQKQFNVDVAKIFSSLNEIYICECPITKLRYFYPFGLDGDSDFYKQLSKNEWYYSKDRWEHEEVIKYIDNSDCVLEIGSGDGVFLKNLVAKKDVSYIGLELNLHAIDRAKNKGIKLTNELLNEHVSIKENLEKYDVVCSFQVFEHISSINDAFLDSLKALKKGGKLIVAVPNNDAEFIGNNIHESKFLNKPPHHVNLFGNESLLKLAEFYDLSVEKIIKEPLHDMHVDFYLYNWFYRKLFSSTFLLRVIWKLKIHTWFRARVRRRRSKIIGHTIIAIYTKK